MLLWLLWGDDVTRIVLHAEDLLFQMCCWAFTMTAEVNTHPACLKLKPRGPINLLLKSVERLAAVGAGLRKKSLLRLKSEWEYHEILGSCPAPVLAVVHCWLVCALCLRCLALFFVNNHFSPLKCNILKAPSGTSSTSVWVAMFHLCLFDDVLGKTIKLKCAVCWFRYCGLCRIFPETQKQMGPCSRVSEHKIT